MFKKFVFVLLSVLLTVPVVMVLGQDSCDAFASGSTAERTSYYMGEGAAFMQSGNLGSAIRSYTCIAEEVDESYEDAFYNRAAAYSARREYDLAVADYTRVIEIDSSYYQAFNNRGVVYAAQGEYDLALDDFTSALSIESDYISAIINRGVISAILDDFAAAESDFQLVVDMAGLEDVIADLQDPDRDPEAPAPEFDRTAVQAYALIGIIHSLRATDSFDDYLFLSGGRADSRIQSAAGALESRFEFELRFDDGSWFLLANLADS